MAERKASLKETLSVAREAVEFALEREEEGRRFHGRGHMFRWEKISFVLSSLRPEELKRLVGIISSVNHGRYIFDSVFPRYENPEDYHSTEFVIYLAEKPVQVLGWKEQKELVQEGVEEGLSEHWIDVGFCNRARKRGIDLEWHFFEHPPATQDETTGQDAGEERLLSG